MDVIETLKNLGCRERNQHGRLFVLDGFDSEFYLIFDASDDPETPEAQGTVDIVMQRVGRSPVNGVRLVANANAHGVLRFLFALGAKRFSEQTRKAMYPLTQVLRGEPSGDSGELNDSVSPEELPHP